jgi:hypothetical protein
LVKRAGANMRCSGKKYRKKEHLFDEEFMKKKKETKEHLRKLEGKDRDESRIEYGGSRKAYERTVENKRCIWQKTTAEYINKLIRQKKVKKMGSRKEYHAKERILNLYRTSRMGKLFSRIVFCKKMRGRLKACMKYRCYVPHILQN